MCIFLFEPELAILVELPVVFLADANNQDKCRRIGLALPVYEEQCHIADFLSAFDQRTDKAQSILDYLLSNRDGLLQQLFI